MLGGTELEYEVLRQRYSIYRLRPQAPMPDLSGLEFVSIGRSESELSIVAPTGAVDPDCEDTRVQEVTGYRGFRIAGQLEFDMVGVLAGITARLAASEIPVLAISTFDTDYLLVPEAKLALAMSVLESRKDGSD